MLTWGYKANGAACLFDLEGEATLPSDWSANHGIIEDPAKRTSEAITEAAGISVRIPVKVKDTFLDVGEGLENPGMERLIVETMNAIEAPKKRKGCPPGGWPKKVKEDVN